MIRPNPRWAGERATRIAATDDLGAADAIDDPVDQLRWFAGSWTFERELTEGAARHRVGGIATFTETDRRIPDSLYSLDFLESGELRLDGSEQSLPVERRLVHHATAAGIDVRFAHGGHYVTLDLAGGSCVAEHPCKADTYLITVSLDDPDTWTEHWQVTGPTKDYTATTRYRRA